MLEIVYCKESPRASEVAQRAKVLAAKPDDFADNFSTWELETEEPRGSRYLQLHHDFKGHPVLHENLLQKNNK